MKKKTLLTLISVAMALGGANFASAQRDFTYQGKLTDECCPANGFYEMRFKLCSTVGGAQVAAEYGLVARSTLAGIKTGIA